MRSLRLVRSIAALGTLAIAAWGGQAYAIEPGSFTPVLAGAGGGSLGGFLPPPGFYFLNTLAYNDGSQQDGNGNPSKTPLNATAYVEIPALVWVTPLHILGASYAAAIIQPIVTLAATVNGATSNKTGLFNTIINPGTLSWRLPGGFFVSAGFSIYFQDGDTGDRGRGTVNNFHVANNTTTFEPAAAVSWFNGHGLETSLNLQYDIQTQNTNFSTALGGEKYQSGDLLNLNFTVVQVLPGAYKKWTVGGVGYYTVQTTDDQITVLGTTQTVPANSFFQNSAGNRLEKFGLGPYIGYDFGPVFLNAWYERDLFAKNSTLGDTFFFQLVVPL